MTQKELAAQAASSSLYWSIQVDRQLSCFGLTVRVKSPEPGRTANPIANDLIRVDDGFS
jgi:hypothetical protein